MKRKLLAWNLLQMTESDETYDTKWKFKNTLSTKIYFKKCRIQV